MPTPVISPSSYLRLCPTALDEGRLAGYLAALSPEARRAFWAAVLILDGKARLATVADRSVYLEGKRPPSLRAVELHAVDVVPDRCLWCDEPLVDVCPTCNATTLSSRTTAKGGRPRMYCSPAHKAAADVEFKRHRRAAQVR